MIYERLLSIHDLLAPGATVYVHLDWRLNSRVKMLLDEIFGKDAFLNEVIWHYKRWPTPAREWQKMHDAILCYVRPGQVHTFNKQYGARTEETQKRWKDKRIVASHSNTGRRVPSQSEEEASGHSEAQGLWRLLPAG
jgi:adenine specific DNA methylase Mod